MTRLRIVDCEDSFTWNLVELFRRAGAEVEVRGAHEPADRLLVEGPDAWILSPGPGRPDDWPCLDELLGRIEPSVPVLGICLGHQAVGLHYGAHLKTEAPVHGEAVPLRGASGLLLRRLDDDTPVMRYNSLGLDPARRPSGLRWTAFGPTGELLALEHVSLPRYGLQFHPDSVLTPEGPRIAGRFLELVREFGLEKAPAMT